MSGTRTLVKLREHFLTYWLLYLMGFIMFGLWITAPGCQYVEPILDSAANRLPSTQPSTQPIDPLADAGLDLLSQAGPYGALAVFGLGVAGLIYRSYKARKLAKNSSSKGSVL